MNFNLFFKTLMFLIPFVVTSNLHPAKLVKKDVIIEMGVKNQIKINDIKRILKDPSKQISKEFNISPGLYDRVLFWSQVYSLYQSTTVLIHDRRELSIIYKVLDVKTKQDTQILNTIIKNINKELVAFSQIDKKTLKIIKPKNEYQKIILEAWKDKFYKTNFDELFKTASQNVRTQTGQRDVIAGAIKSSSMYISEIKSVFKDYGLPEELIKLPFVESSFNPKAVSKVGAGGLWQIMGYAGGSDIKMEEHIDERFSPAKSAIVAAKMLKTNYEKLGSWPLAVTSYNYGLSGVLKATKESGTKDLVKIISDYKNSRWKFASQNFYAEFLAALYVTTYYEDLFGQVSKFESRVFENITLTKSVNIFEIAKKHKTSVDTIASYNPELSEKVLNGKAMIQKNHVIKIPYNKADSINEFYY